MELGVHLPQVGFSRPAAGLSRLQEVVDTTRELGFAAISANDHFTFPRPWLDGPTVLAAVADRAGPLDLVTTIGLPSLRGPVPYAAGLVTLAALVPGRVVAAPLVRRRPDELRDRICVGTPAHCADLLTAYAAHGCGRIYCWPVADEVRQLRLLAQEVLHQVAAPR